MKKTNISLLLALFFCFLFVIPTHSASIKERMAGRIPEINKLKDQEAIGENNEGFLEYRIPDRPKQNIVDNENKDRGIVYKIIAKREGASVKLVGERRAKMIAKKGKKGHWYQNPEGVWYKK